MSHHQKEIEYTSEDCTRILQSLVKRVSRVRVRLVIEGVLQTLALGLAILPVYVFIYAWIDHNAHLGIVFRSLALGGLLIAVGWLLLLWARILLSHISLSRAANYIESKRSYQQQLVAAIEYYEQEDEYPYSRGLAEQMVRQINEETKDDKFVRTMRKWPSLISLAIVVCAFVCIGYLINTNYKFYSRYFTRLVKPIAHVEPMPPTNIETLSGDVVAEPREPLKLIAAIKGRTPESGTLYVESVARSDDPNDNIPDQSMSIPLLANEDEEGHDVFQAQFALREKGNYTYYFKTGESRTKTHQITITEFPKIESMTAEITVTSSRWIPPYTEEVKNYFLSVFENSHVTLNVKVNQALGSANVVLPDQRRLNAQFQEPNLFSIAFKTTQEGKLSFSLTNADGLQNRKPITLQMRLKQDNPPKFELISPGSDYIANNVASIPIEFKVSDDFALQRGSIHLEFNNGDIVTVPPVDAPPGSNNLTLTYHLELEDYDLDISDSIIFYASAKDVDTNIGQYNPIAWSTPYFIEIRPYRKIIKQPDTPMPSMEKQGMQMPTGGMDNILTVLEYNRAFLKKTWILSQKKQLQEEDESRMNAISDDVTYAADQLELIRDNPMSDFTDEQEGTINGILSHYNAAAKTLVKHKPKQAVPPEKAGYYDLRGLIKELIECPPPVAGTPPEGRDKLELKDPVHVNRYEKERIEWQMEKLAQELAELAKEQEQLQEEFVKFLEQEKKKQLTQKVNDAKTWAEENETENPRIPPSDKKPGQQQPKGSMQGATVKLKNPPSSAGSQGQPQENQPEQQESDQTQQEQDNNQEDSAMAQGEGEQNNQDQQSEYGESKETAKNEQTQQNQSGGQDQGQEKQDNNQENSAMAQGEGEQNNQGQQSEYGESKETAKNEQTQQNQSGGQGQGQGNTTTNEMMRMMQAQQKTLQDKIHQLSKKLTGIPIPDEQVDNDGTMAAQTRQAAKEHLEKAAEAMAKFEKILSDQYFQSEFSEQSMELAGAILEQVQTELNHAEFEMVREFASDSLQLALGSENVAKQLEELSNAYEKSVSEAEKRELQELLQQATALLESLPEGWTQSLQEESVSVPAGTEIPQSRKETPRAQNENASLPDSTGSQQAQNRTKTQQGRSQTQNSQNSTQTGGQTGSPGNTGISHRGSGPDPDLIQRARSAARHFWSVAIAVRKKTTPLTETQFTHPEFTEEENKFFEKTATYGMTQEQR